jgi:MFS family permease
MKAFIIQTLRRFGFRRVLIVNGVITVASITACATLSPGMPTILIVAILYFHGGCRSLEFTCMTTLAFSEIESSSMSRANSFLSAVMQLSSGMGIAVGAITLRLIAHARGHSAAVPQLFDFHLAILLIALLALGPVFDSLGLAHDAGANTSGHVQPEMEAFM